MQYVQFAFILKSFTVWILHWNGWWG